MQICPYCGLREDDDDLNDSQRSCRCDTDDDFELNYEGMLEDGEAFLREEKESRPINANTALKIIRCEGCGRTETVAPWKLIPCDGYTCAEKGCEVNPAFKLPYPDKGPVLVLAPNAAGSFWGYTIRDFTPEERRNADQVRAILVPALTKIN